VTPRNVVIQGNALEVLRGLAPDSVDCVVTSPPYFAVRDYGMSDQLGMEASINDWARELRLVAAEIARVLVPWGAFWLNVGDVYARTSNEGAPPKSLLLGPERLAQGLLADGWIVRNRLAWVKPNPMPSSAADRLTGSWEFVYLLVRQGRYFFDLDAIREPPVSSGTRPRCGSVRCTDNGSRDHGHSGLDCMKRLGLTAHPLGKNPGDVWRIASKRPREHAATFPAELIRRPILATCPEKVCLGCGKPWQRARHPVQFADGKPRPRALVPCGCGVATRAGLVLDPFLGSGTTALVARRHGRDWLGIELNPEYVQLTERRLKQTK
jgi:site-specific DNA-methyltransferase (adenine-specific)